MSINWTEIDKRLSQLKPSDTLTIRVHYRKHTHQAAWYLIEVHCSRQVWKAIYRRSGRTGEWEYGRAKTQAAAEKQAHQLRKRLLSRKCPCPVQVEESQ